MSKPFDPRVIAKANVLHYRITPNVCLSQDPPVWAQRVVIDYALVDADGNHLATKAVPHEHVSGEVKPTLRQSAVQILQDMGDWIAADKLALADNSAE